MPSLIFTTPIKWIFEFVVSSWVDSVFFFNQLLYNFFNFGWKYGISICTVGISSIFNDLQLCQGGKYVSSTQTYSFQNILTYFHLIWCTQIFFFKNSFCLNFLSNVMYSFSLLIRNLIKFNGSSLTEKKQQNKIEKPWIH